MLCINTVEYFVVINIIQDIVPLKRRLINNQFSAFNSSIQYRYEYNLNSKQLVHLRISTKFAILFKKLDNRNQIINVKIILNDLRLFLVVQLFNVRNKIGIFNTLRVFCQQVVTFSEIDKRAVKFRGEFKKGGNIIQCHSY